jgi:ABC-type lipoprotein export system ATPase subunit
VFKIQTIQIDGFWGKFRLITDLNDDINIFIGRNGTGKTTLINFLQAIMTADLDLLASLQFDTVKLLLKDYDKTRTIEVSRMPDEVEYGMVKYRIGRHSVPLPLLPREMEYRRRRLHPKFLNSLNEVRESLGKLATIVWISVYRELLEDEYREPFSHRPTYEKNPIDRRLDDLANRFTQYQLQLQSEINHLSDSFRNKVLASMLYNESFDKFSLGQEGNLDLAKVKKGLLHTYEELGALEPEVSKSIDNHIQKIAKAIQLRKDFDPSKNQRITIDDLLPLSLLRRTQHIVDLSTEVENQKKAIFEPVDSYLNILRDFAIGKNFKLDSKLSGELQVQLGDKILPLDQLSSGEKQLLILFTEALLQKKQRCVFIADEPELSLHIEWQRKVIDTIRSLNPNSQLIVATHSPEIAGHWRSKLIRMEDIVHS